MTLGTLASILTSLFLLAGGCYKTATIGAAAVTCLWYGPFSIRPHRAGNTPAAGCPPAVSAPEGHGMILAERCVDIEDTTYRVTLAGLGP